MHEFLTLNIYNKDFTIKYAVRMWSFPVGVTVLHFPNEIEPLICRLTLFLVPNVVRETRDAVMDKMSKSCPIPQEALLGEMK